MPWFQNQPWPTYAFFEIFVGHLDICLLSSKIRFTEFEEPEESIDIKYFSGWWDVQGKCWYVLCFWPYFNKDLQTVSPC